MKIICKNTKNIIIAVAFAFIFLVNASPAEAECHYNICPAGYTYTTNFVGYWSYGGHFTAGCFPCGGYCWVGIGYPQGPVCAHITSYWGSYPLADSCISPGSYLSYCNAECAPNHFGCKIGPARAQRNEATGWAWYCEGYNGRNDYCFEPYPVNGACQTFPSGVNPLPVSICSAGTASAVSGNGTNSFPWTWTCAGSGGGTTANCTAKKPCVYDNYRCERSMTDEKCVDNYLKYCEKTLAVNMICNAIDVNGTCSAGALSQSDCVAHGVPCANSTETCAPCPLEPGRWREVAP